jgi:hypothetical protein
MADAEVQREVEGVDLPDPVPGRLSKLALTLIAGSCGLIACHPTSSQSTYLGVGSATVCAELLEAYARNRPLEESAHRRAAGPLARDTPREGLRDDHVEALSVRQVAPATGPELVITRALLRRVLGNGHARSDRGGHDRGVTTDHRPKAVDA